MLVAHANRKQQIITAAMEIISESGAQNLTMLAIAERLGISDAALYRHFRSKFDLLRAMIEHFGRDLIGTLSAAVAAIDDPLVKLQHVLQHHLHYLEANRGVPRLIFSEAVHQHNPELQRSVLSIINHYVDFIQGILLRAVTQGKMRKDLDLETTAFAFIGLIQATCFIWSLSDYNFPLADRAQRLWKVFSESLT